MEGIANRRLFKVTTPTRRSANLGEDNEVVARRGCGERHNALGGPRPVRFLQLTAVRNGGEENRQGKQIRGGPQLASNSNVEFTGSC